MSTKVSRDLNTNEKHTHNIGNNNRRNPSRRIRNLDTLRAIPIKSKVHQHNSDSTQYKHEPRGESLNDVLPIDATGKKNHGSDGSGRRVLGGSDSGRLDDDIVDEAGDDHEISEEDESVDGHRRREGKGRKLETEARRTEEGKGENAEDMEDGIDGGDRRICRCGGGRDQSGGFGFGRHFSWPEWIQRSSAVKFGVVFCFAAILIGVSSSSIASVGNYFEN